MKLFGTSMLAAVALVAASCSGTVEETTPEEEVVEAVTYSLDKDNSSLEWAANMGPDYGHMGTVAISEGTLTMEADAVKEGNFTIDMASIKSTDLEEPKAGYLAGHLTGFGADEKHPVDMFFNVPEFPTVSVAIDGYSEGTLNLTLTILGKELKQDVAAELKADENGASISGDFSLDLTSLVIPGLQPNPEDGSQINPVIDFKLNAALTK